MSIELNLFFGLFLLWLSWIVFQALRPRNIHSLRSVAVLVLGDIGRSPRMMYHAQSFAENDFETHLIGYGGSRPIPSLERLPLVKLRYLPEFPTSLGWLPFIIRGPLKVIHQTISIFLELLVHLPVPPEFILVQNPPSIPSLFVVWIVGRVRGCKVIIDWHNLGYSILALKLGSHHLFVRIYEWIEATFGRSAYAHLFVTRALHDYLVKEWNLRGEKVVLHDRPPHHFHHATAQETHELFRKLDPTISANNSLTKFLPEYNLPYSTGFTHTNGSNRSRPRSPPPGIPLATIPVTATKYQEIKAPSLRADRPAMLVSSTSWTPDEDFSILLDALKKYDTEARNNEKKLPKLLMIITGKGDNEDFMAQVQALHKEWQFVRCISLWLEAGDYPILLGSADLGISLHSSSSKMDLPMKVVDMFGCGLPVCALDFDCLDELVKDGVNGLVFENSQQLFEHLTSLLASFPDAPALSALSETVQSATQDLAPNRHQRESNKTWQWGSWSENWDVSMRPLIMRDVHRE